MADEKWTDHEIEALFDAARHSAPAPSADLMARILSDADNLQAQAHPKAAVARAPLSRWRALVDLLGGWPAMAGLVSAGVAGLWLGVNPPDMLSDLPLAGFVAAEQMLTGMMPGVELDLLALEEG